MKKRFRKRSTETVVAVQLQLETEGFSYQKWGGTQVCKAGDWIVNNNGEVYTIDQRTFSDTYREIAPGQYYKAQIVWAEVAGQAGTVETKEGATGYEAGDYLVCNDEGCEDSYAVGREVFEKMYEPVPEDA